MYFRFVDDIMISHNRPGKVDANRAYIQSDSTGPGPRAKSDVCNFLASLLHFF